MEKYTEPQVPSLRELDHRFTALKTQRDNALDENVLLHGELAMAWQMINDLQHELFLLRTNDNGGVVTDEADAHATE